MTPQKERGFTLGEILVVIAIIAVLAGIATGTYAALIDDSATDAADTEKITVQTAMDIHLSTNKLTNLTARSEANAAVITSTDSDAPFKDYLRLLPTQKAYWWTSEGVLTQVDPSEGGDTHEGYTLDDCQNCHNPSEIHGIHEAVECSECHYVWPASYIACDNCHFN